MQESHYLKDPKLYQEHLLEQYKIYVEMADRISARRNLANVFFLTLHSTFITAIGFSIEKVELVDPKGLVLIPIAAILIFCFVWWWLIRSYRSLNTAKYKVIGDLEKELPKSPYWSMEWKELGEGKDPSKYVPLTAIENWVPILFGFLYVCLAVYVVVIQ